MTTQDHPARAPGMGEITRLLEQMRKGDPGAEGELLLALDEAPTRLAQSEPHAAELVNLRFFIGLTQEQAAKELGISRRHRRAHVGICSGLAVPRDPEEPKSAGLMRRMLS